MPTKVHLVKAMVFPVVMYGCESWTIKKAECPKNGCYWTVVLEKILESPLESREIQTVHPKGNQSWIFIGRTDTEAETPILCPPDAKNWPTGKSPDAGKDWRQEENGMTEDEMVEWHLQFNGPWVWVVWRRKWRPTLVLLPGESHGQKSLVGYHPCICKVRHDWATNIHTHTHTLSCM